MYFGVETLLKDITDPILADINRNASRQLFYEEALIFHDY
jgi:hypothetical protein